MKIITINNNSKGIQMQLQIAAVACLLSIASATSLAENPSFDCAKATNKPEKLICADKGLAEVDGMLAMAYKDSLENASDKAAIKRRQIEWLKNDRNLCADVACLQRAYDKRFEELSTRTQRNAEGSPIGSEISVDAAAALAAKNGVPARFHGVWSDDKDGCAMLKSGLNTDKIITIKLNQINGYGFSCQFKSGEINGSSFDGKFSCKDEEEGKTANRNYLLSTNSQNQLLLSIKGTKSLSSPMIACEGANASSKSQVRNGAAENRIKPAKNISANNQERIPLVSCSAEDQIGMVDPKTGRMSQRAIDIQMARVKCR